MPEAVAADVDRVAHDDTYGQDERHHHEKARDRGPRVLDFLVPHVVPGEPVTQTARNGQGQVAEGNERPDGRGGTDCVEANQPQKRNRFGQLVEDLLGLGVLNGVCGHVAYPSPSTTRW